MGVEQYRSLFVSESEEHLQNINAALLELEKDANNAEILNTIFRSAHTLKGMSATMGFEGMTRLTHKMEDVLDVFRGQKVSVTSEVVDIMFRCMDMLELLLEEIKTEKDLHLDVNQIVMHLESIIPSVGSQQFSGREVQPIALTAMERKNLEQVSTDTRQRICTVQVSLAADCQLKAARVFMIVNKLTSLGEVVKTQPSIEDLELGRFGLSFLLLFLSKATALEIRQNILQVLEVEKVEVKTVAKLSDMPEEAAPEPRHIPQPEAGKEAGRPQTAESAPVLGVKRIQSIRVTTARLDKLMNLVGELVIVKIRLMQMALTQRDQGLNELFTNIDRLTSELQDEVMQARLIPIAQVFDRFPRMVRDLARSEQKQVNLEIRGGEIELDRTVLDEIADPLVHLLRNSVDHGIEWPQVRKTAGKNPVGTIRLSAQRERTFVKVEVADDGKGIDPALMRQVAVNKGFMTEEAVTKLSDREVLDMILLPGFSSSATITDTSGRGVGMDVVKSKIESLGGSLMFNSELGKGSAFDLRLPLTVAIIRAMLVKVGSEIYAIPIANIAETVKIALPRVKRIEKCEVINLRNEVLPLIRLERLLSIKLTSESTGTDLSVVVVESSSRRAGLVVDEVLGQQEVVIKTVGTLIKSIKGFAGATILGDGRVALILDVATLVS